MYECKYGIENNNDLTDSENNDSDVVVLESSTNEVSKVIINFSIV